MHIATVVPYAMNVAEYMAQCEQLVVDEHCGHLPSESATAEYLVWCSELARQRLTV